MECRICHNSEHNKELILREMMYGFRDEFTYFQCNSCGCIQIKDFPKDMSKYYPKDYYSFNAPDIPLKRSIIRKIHFDYYAHGINKILGKIISLNFKPSLFYNWLKDLHLQNREARILDVGCGNGQLLKRIFRLGFNDLTGADPFIEKDILLNENLRIYKKEIFELSGHYDIIMLHHSLEHMERQEDIIRKIVTLLSNDGSVLIRIPIVSKALMEKYGVNVATLDAPRHFFIHSLQSIKQLLSHNGLFIQKIVYESELFSILASEQYMRGVSIVNDERSYIQNRNSTIFTKEQLIKFQEEIDQYNKKQESDFIAIYAKLN